MLTSQQFSDIVNAGALLMLVSSIIVLIIFLTNKKFKNYIDGQPYKLFMWKIFIISFIAVFSANIYEFVYNDAPCLLCWYSRILIYPILIISIVELFKKTRTAYIYIAAFAFLELLLSIYHYSFHFRRYVLGDIFMPCSTNPLLPDCTQSKIISFGFATMPLMAICLSASVLLITYFASRTKK
jgi:disulfide bond formation protein DsbB